MKKVVTKSEQIKFEFPAMETLESLYEYMRESVDQQVKEAGLLIYKAYIDDEVRKLTGERYSRTEKAGRWGKESGYMYMGGQRLSAERPRIRENGKEVPLKTYKEFQRKDRFTEAVFRQMIAGVSTRNYRGAIQAVEDGCGMGRTTISEAMKEATAKELESFCERSLDEFQAYVLIIDAVKVAKSSIVVAVGIAENGEKKALGMRLGATENAQVCIELLEDLKRRGFNMEHPVLIVIDGSKGLRSAVERFFGDWAAVQRCQFHKRQNVLDHLPKKYHSEYRRKIQSAYKMRRYEDASRALQSVIQDLEYINPDAAGSLREGLEETLTVHRLDIPDILRKSFSTTNVIESSFSMFRTITRNVKRWRNADQILRWTGTGLLRAESRFRKLKGYRVMPMLVNALNCYAIEKGLVIKRSVV